MEQEWADDRERNETAQCGRSGDEGSPCREQDRYVEVGGQEGRRRHLRSAFQLLLSISKEMPPTPSLVLFNARKIL